MRLSSCFLALIPLLGVGVAPRATSQNESGWHISPTEMNIRVGERRPLQLLDALGSEFHTNDWTVDQSDLADITAEDGRAVLNPKAPGVVNVVAFLDGVAQNRKVTIWPAASRLRGVHWRVPPLGREIANLQAAPTTDGGPDLYSLDETDRGTYVRAFTNEGIQLWLWRLPEAGRKVQFVCGDNLGGVILAAIRPDSYTLYTVEKEGKLLWEHKLEGVKKGHALNYDNLLHVINQAADGTWARIVAIEGKSGVEKFSLAIPPSTEKEINITRVGDKVICVPGRSVAHALRTLTSGLFVNTDEFAYAAFSQGDWTLGTSKCASGSAVDPKQVYISRADKLVLWQIHDDGSVQATIVDEGKERTFFAVPLTVMSPTGDIIPDGLGGVLLSVRWTHADIPQKITSTPDEFVYRITQDGAIAYKFPLPKYSGPLHDEMVLGEKDLGFATRGGMLVAFDVKDGSEVWRWDSGAPEIKINMATAGGGCAVDTPEGMVLVEDGVKKRVVAPAGSQMYTPGEYIRTAH